MSDLPPQPGNPYAAPTARLDNAPEEAAEELQYAGFWIRFLASAIDSVLIGLVTTPLFFLFYFVVKSKSLGAVPDVIINWVLPAALVIGFWIWRGATPGKMVISARIVDAETGREPSTGQYIGRYFGYFLASLPLGLGILWVAWDPRKQGWHDKMAGTVAIRRIG